MMCDGIPFRTYKMPTQRQLKEIVVPKIFRPMILKLAHEGIMAGHQEIRKTRDRILEEFYWPRIQEDLKRFVKSCHDFQRTVPRRLVRRALLRNVPLIDTPF